MRFLLYVMLAAIPALAQAPSEKILQAWGGASRFPALYRESVDAFFTAELAYRGGEYRRARDVLTAFWAKHPAGTHEWADAVADTDRTGIEKGANFGSPACYNALRILTECVDWKLSSKRPANATRTVMMSIVLVGRSNGIYPDWISGGTSLGQIVKHTLTFPAGTAGDEIISQLLFLFSEYVEAITDGHLRLKWRVVQLPELDLPVVVTQSAVDVAGLKRHLNFAGLSPGAINQVWRSVTPSVKAETDWWMVIYPSHVPLDYAEPRHMAFISGGMGTGPDGRSPAFVSDDLFFLRVPAHMGHGPIGEYDRRAYSPAWMLHEFFHHLYRTYPPLHLEDSSHQWFDRSKWPSDFEGLLPFDYYIESIRKRLRFASPSLFVTLRYAPAPTSLLTRLSLHMVCGKYRREPYRNAWHEGTIACSAEGTPTETSVLRWTNAAGVSWSLTPDFPNGSLRFSVGNPYVKAPDRAQSFQLVVQRDANGDYVPEVAGFTFEGEFYGKLNQR